METVEIVIKIPKEYKDYIEGGAGIIPDKIIQYLFNALDNGTVLPKGHGRLIDADKYKFDNEDGFRIGFGDDAMNVFKISVDNTPTVIEADRDGDADG